MSNFPWLPLGYKLTGGAVGRLQHEGVGYQLVQNLSKEFVFLLIEHSSLAAKAVNLISPNIVFDEIEFGQRSLLSRPFGIRERPIVVREWPKQIGLLTSSDAFKLGEAVKGLRKGFPTVDVSAALFLPEFGVCMPTCEAEAASPQNLSSLAIELLAGGAQVESFDVDLIRSINSWLTPEEIYAFFAAFGVDLANKQPEHRAVDVSSFSLPGRPELEAFFREYVLEPTADRERYEAFGVKMPNGVLLYGPPGSGKSHAVGRLIAALGWPLFEINLGSMGSPFVHQTSVALKKIFDEAKRKSPALIVLEEIDALAASRGPMSHDHKVEEVTELLRLVESAAENKILVLATTNRIEALDPAIRRKGRFDHAIEVGYPTATEVHAAIDAMLTERPHHQITNISQIATLLAGRPMSDIAWLINESARLAARSRKEAIEESDMLSALKALKLSLTAV